MSDRSPSFKGTRREAIGQVLCPTLFGGPLHQRPFDLEAARRDLAEHAWGGYILFHGEAAATRAWVAALQADSRLPLLVAADMERGAGQHLAGLHTFPAAMAFGACERPDWVREWGRWTAREALAHGVNWILAPVADVNSNPLNPIINLRSFGEDPARVAELVAAFVEGVQAEGALACAKHFPGHGDTATDSHTMLARVEGSRARLETLEWPPFRAAIRARVATLMSAHLAMPGLGVEDLPATLSAAIMTGVLREELGFDGLVVTDALIMGGITRTMAPERAAVLALAAGCDMLLMPPDPAAAVAALEAAVATGELAEERIFAAATRVMAAKARLGTPPAAPAGAPAALADRVAAGAMTCVRGVPYPLSARTGWLTLDDGADAAMLEDWARAREGQPGPAALVRTADPQTAWQAAAASLGPATEVVVTVFSPVRIHKDRSLLPERLVRQVHELVGERPFTVLSASSPYVVAQFPTGAAVLTFGTHPAQLRAAVAALGSGHYPGRAPVTLPAALAPVASEAPGGGAGPAFA